MKLYKAEKWEETITESEEVLFGQGVLWNWGKGQNEVTEPAMQTPRESAFRPEVEPVCFPQQKYAGQFQSSAERLRVPEQREYGGEWQKLRTVKWWESDHTEPCRFRKDSEFHGEWNGKSLEGFEKMSDLISHSLWKALRSKAGSWKSVWKLLQ